MQNQSDTIKHVYSANLTAGGLLLPESRVLARLLLEGVGIEELCQKTLSLNLLQKRSPITTKRIVTLVKGRLSTMEAHLLQIVAEGSREEASLLLLAAIVQCHRIVGDFCLYIGRECVALYKSHVTDKDWDIYYDQCCALQPTMTSWSVKTAAKLRSVVFKILVECGLLQAHTLAIQPLFLPLSVQSYLSHPEHYYARTCLEALHE